MQLIKFAAILAATGLVQLTTLADESRPAPANQPPSQIQLDGNPFGQGQENLFIVQPESDAPQPGQDIRQQVNAEREQVLQRLNEARHGVTFVSDMAKREKGAYLGVSASPSSAVLRKQLGLSAGMGLIVDFVVPDSPAGKAGLLQYDVLQKLDDQLLVNPQQLAVLVRSHKPDEEVKLGIIREGKPMTLSAKLVEHELDPLEGEQPDDGPGMLFRAIPGPMVRPYAPGEKSFSISRSVQPNGAASITYIEDGASYTILIDIEGHTTFSGRDKDGKVMFENPIDTKEQRDKLSADQKQKLERMEKHMPGRPADPFWKKAQEKPATQPGAEEKSEKK